MHKLKLTWLFGLALLMISTPALATQIRNVVTLKGSEQSKISGIGVVVGLDGTGDGEFGPAHKAVLAAVARNIDPTATPQNFTDADSIALVHVSATIPGQGVREGVDQLDVTVATINDAESLKAAASIINPLEVKLKQALQSAGPAAQRAQTVLLEPRARG